MSKLLDKITEAQTGRRFVKRSKFDMTKIDYSVIDNTEEHQKEYSLGVELKVKYIARNNSMDEEIVKELRHAIQEEVFGEFRPYIMQITWALANHDTDSALDNLFELRNAMFPL